MRKLLLASGFIAGAAGLAMLVRQLPATQDPALLTAALQYGPAPLHFTWRSIDGKYWQIVGESTESQEETDRREGTRGACPTGMVEIRGNMLTDPPNTGIFDPNSIEEKQKTTCTKWINREYPERCTRFERDKWLELRKDYSTTPMHYCMDRFEYPNQKGQYPLIFVNYDEAQTMCASEGKRLCNENEWTFACEGEEAMPYPYGYVRSPDACVIDRPWRAFNTAAMHPRDGAAAMAEFDRLWQGVQSGSRPQCKSGFGVYDMTGNVDEWTTSMRPGRRSILKGGYWGPVRTRCRPSTRSHDENHTFYQQGFRCCADAPEAPVVPTAYDDPAIAPLPREVR